MIIWLTEAWTRSWSAWRQTKTARPAQTTVTLDDLHTAIDVVGLMYRKYFGLMRTMACTGPGAMWWEFESTSQQLNSTDRSCRTDRDVVSPA